MNSKFLMTACAVAAVGLIASGCTARRTALNPAEVAQMEALQEKDEQIAKLETSLDRLEQDFQAKEAEARAKAEAAARSEKAAEEAMARAREMEQKAASSQAVKPAGAPGGDLLPGNAKTGECYARVFIPPQYKTVTERLMAKQASERIEIIPAKYEWVEEKILVKEASERLEVVPAKYDWVEEKVQVKPSAKNLVDVPAEYDWVEEKVLVEPAHTVWKKGRGLIEKVDNATGEIMCLVEVPAKYKTVRRKVNKQAATTRETEVPAAYKTVKKRVLVSPATTRKIEVPAEYTTVKVQKLVSPAKERRIEIPEEYQEITKTEMIAEGKMEWRQVLCETNMTHETIMSLQQALLQKGHNPGPIDGIYGGRTRAAVREYQQAKGLPTGGLTLRTLESLGLSYK